jgi:hypothetical protein
MYNDEYNRKVASTSLKRSARKALNVDRLNGAGARSYDNTGDRTEHPASYWFKQENQVFKDNITRPDVEPESVIRERAARDLGAGRYRGGMVGMPDRGSLSAIEPGSVIRERANLDLGAGKSGGGASGGFLPLLGLAAASFLPKLLGQGSSGSGNSGGIVGMYMRKEIGKGQMTKMIKDALPHGKKKMAGGISKEMCSMYGRKRGRGYSGGYAQCEESDDDEDYDEESDMEGGALPLHETGRGISASRQVGGKTCNCKCKCGRGMTGGIGPVAPTTESLYGYDNRNQPKGLIPPPSVNQEPGMGDSQYLSGGRRKKGGFLGPLMKTLGKVAIPLLASKFLGSEGSGKAPVRMSQLGRHMIPQDNLPSNTGGARMCPSNYDPVTDEQGRTYSNRCAMSVAKSGKGKSGGRSLANTTNYASNSGSIVPALQSRVSIGSGARSARGAMVRKLMQEKGMSLGQASKYIKEHGLK